MSDTSSDSEHSDSSPPASSGDSGSPRLVGLASSSIQLLRTPSRLPNAAQPSPPSTQRPEFISPTSLSSITPASSSPSLFTRIPVGRRAADPPSTPSTSRRPTLPPGISTSSDLSSVSSSLVLFSQIPDGRRVTELSTPTRAFHINSSVSRDRRTSLSPRKRGREGDDSDEDVYSTPRQARQDNLFSPGALFDDDYQPDYLPSSRESSIQVRTPSPAPPVAPPVGSNSNVEDYWDCLYSLELVRVRIDECTWVVEHFDRVPKPGYFHHVTAVNQNNSTFEYFCDCPSGRNGITCLHVTVIKRHWITFNEMPSLFDDLHPPVSLISRDHLRCAAWYSVSSNPQSQRRAGGKRVVVRHVKHSKWECRKCTKKEACEHIKAAQEYRAACQQVRVEESDEEGGVNSDQAGRDSSGDSGSDEDEADADQAVMDDIRAMGLDDAASDDERVRAASALLQKKPVSFCRISTPSWCALPMDDPFVAIPWRDVDVLKLSPGDRCKCGGHALDDEEIRVIEARVFGLDGPTSVKVEVAMCSKKCRPKHRWTVGPDLGRYYLFNWSNTFVFDNVLMGHALSMLVSSPTPISSMRTVFSNTYEEISRLTATEVRFPSKPTWTRAFIAYLSLLNVDVGMQCSVCGEHPRTVIADGVSVAFNQDRLSKDLQTPTTPGPERRSEVKPIKDLTFLPTPALRRTVQTATRLARPNSTPLGPDEVDDVGLDMAVQILRGSTVKDVSTRRRVDGIVNVLEDVQRGLENRASVSVFQNRRVLTATMDFVEQLAAHEMTLQLCPYSLCSWIDGTNPNSTQQNYEDHQLWERSRLLCPALFHLLDALRSFHIPLSLRRVTHLLSQHVHSLFDRLNHRQNDPPPLQAPPPRSPPPINNHDVEWLRTGSRYGMPAIRQRPLYSSIKGEGSTSSGGVTEAALCQKFYNEYSKRKQTGGIMAFWCPHLICLGFHIIAKAEGRNDVFSGIWCHWPVAPSKLLYDFGCALMPYAMLREPQYWIGTQVVIDQLHENNHTKCSPACFASSYMGDNPEWRRINSSAAECGNAGLGRIRKSVSYADQRTAMLIVSKFVDVWNRKRILNASK